LHKENEEHLRLRLHIDEREHARVREHTATYCNTLQHTATHVIACAQGERAHDLVKEHTVAY